MLQILLLIVVGTTIWVGFDSKDRDWSGELISDSPAKWVIGCLLCWIVVFPLYLSRRGRVAITKGLPR